MNRQCVAAFIQMYLTALTHQENAYRHPGEEKGAAKALNEAPVRRIIPFVYRNRVWTLDKSLWPMILEDFKELNHHLSANLPRVHVGHHWQMISYFFYRSGAGTGGVAAIGAAGEGRHGGSETRDGKLNIEHFLF